MPKTDAALSPDEDTSDAATKGSSPVPDKASSVSSTSTSRVGDFEVDMLLQEALAPVAPSKSEVVEPDKSKASPDILEPERLPTSSSVLAEPESQPESSSTAEEPATMPQHTSVSVQPGQLPQGPPAVVKPALVPRSSLAPPEPEISPLNRPAMANEQREHPTELARKKIEKEVIDLTLDQDETTTNAPDSSKALLVPKGEPIDTTSPGMSAPVVKLETETAGGSVEVPAHVTTALGTEVTSSKKTEKLTTAQKEKLKQVLRLDMDENKLVHDEIKAERTRIQLRRREIELEESDGE